MGIPGLAPFHIDTTRTPPQAWCAGPGADGECPAAVPGRPVACAGYVLLLACPFQSPIWRRQIGEGEERCPLAVAGD